MFTNLIWLIYIEMSTEKYDRIGALLIQWISFHPKFLNYTQTIIPFR